MNSSLPYRLISGFMSTLLLWNLCGWWLYPVVHGVVDQYVNSGEVCCNGAEICCCKAGGADACYCLPNQEHNDDTPLVCGISTPDAQPNAEDNGVLVFFELRATLSKITINHPFTQPPKKRVIHKDKPTKGFTFELLRPPLFHQDLYEFS